MRRLTLNTAIVLALALTFSACGGGTSRNPLGPDAPVLQPPLNGPHSELRWEFWIGDPSCIMGCPGVNPQMLLQGGTGDYGVSTVGNTRHLLQGKVHFPTVTGHRIRFTTTIPDPNGKPTQTVSEETTGNKMSGIDFGRGFTTPSQPGSYNVDLLVEEWGDDLPGGLVALRAVINITVE